MNFECRSLPLNHLAQRAGGISTGQKPASGGKRAVTRLRSRPLAAKLTSTTERRLRNRFLAGEAPRIRSRPLAAKRAVPRIRSRPLAAKLTSATERRLRNRFLAGLRNPPLAASACAPCFVQELVARAQRRPLAAETTLGVHRHLRPLEDAEVHGRPLAVQLRPEGAARARRRRLPLAPTLPVHLRPQSAARGHGAPNC